MKTYTSTTTTTLNVETKPIPGLPGFVVYRCTQEIKTGRHKPQQGEWEGICTAKKTLESWEE